MAFLRSGLGQESHLFVRGDRLVLRPLAMSDYPAWAEIRALSRSHLIPWEPAWSRDELSRSAFRRRLRFYQREAREDMGYAFAIFEEPGGTLAGGVSLSNVRRGVTQAAALGYWLGEPFCGRGLMTRALAALVPFAFDELRLHRIEAACMPQNTASVAVLRRSGFEQEGLARRYLKINGAWRDHLLFAMVAGDAEGEGRPAHDW